MRLDPGTVLLQGPNGHGKSNLIEAIHMLSVARSTRASSEAELINTEALARFPVYAQIFGAVELTRGQVRLQLDLGSNENSSNSSREQRPRPTRVQKTLQVNGVKRRSNDFVGVLKAVQFSPEDVELSTGAPQVRRRFLDMLISQLSHSYLADWQEYNRVLRQRNHLLRAIREGTSSQSELEFWDIRFAVSAGRIMAERLETLDRLGRFANEIHAQLSNSDNPLALTYQPSSGAMASADPREVANRLLEDMRGSVSREIAAGHTLIGPHRDDLSASIGDMDVGGFASRGQARTVVLALKLAEARLISESTGDEPVILLDDIMSELDPSRQGHVIDFTSRYEQVVITTAEPGLADQLGIEKGRRLFVESGKLASAV